MKVLSNFKRKKCFFYYLMYSGRKDIWIKSQLRWNMYHRTLACIRDESKRVDRGIDKSDFLYPYENLTKFHCKMLFLFMILCDILGWHFQAKSSNDGYGDHMTMMNNYLCFRLCTWNSQSTMFWLTRVYSQEENKLLVFNTYNIRLEKQYLKNH